ncbi:restriction endonuclease subunit S [Psychrobacter sp. SCQQ22]|uniref:restriction endonuclease subunit S n=1 Tax=Psychrobacter sp. SCQQ22 TaxID=2792059 RepID=UPI0018CF90EF|nr:restriction endonuclease subunit S [Psychrobacter sp. SCQQ22]MBH0086008.1 restriction endonuclease subunit S [Psychrobacter sp. SCQQ22]
MAKYQQYEEYKDSGVEWLGQVPSEWSVSPLKLYLNTRKGVAFKSADFTDIGIRVVKASDIKDKTIRQSEVFLPSSFSEIYPKSVLKEGEIIISTVGSTPDVKNSAVGQIGILPFELDGSLLNQNTVVLSPKNNVLSNLFLFYLIQTDVYREHLDLNAHGTANQASLNISDILNFTFARPTIQDQAQIANFLDHETDQIDTLIEKQQTLIQLLKEKRQAVISHAVTKGLNPDAPMKDSGVEWLGDVPEHWEVTRIKYITSMFEQGWSPQCDSHPATSDEYGVLKVGCVNYGSFHSIENKALPPELQPRLQYLIEKRDLLISRANTKELVGSAAVVNQDYNNLLLCDKLYRLRFNSNIQPELIALYLSIEPVREQIELQASGASSSMQNISQDVIKELPCFLLPNEEAYELLSYFSEKMKVFDNLVSKAQKAIQLMQERRTALISAAVTGKIDVRGWVASDSK